MILYKQKMYKASGGRRSKVQQRRRISKQQRRSRRPGEDDDPNWVMTRTRASDPTHIPLLTTEEKEYLRLASLPEIASSRRHQVENGGRRRGRRISRRRK